jgi:hypothetical protein
MLRSLSAAVLALAICACEPNLPQVTPSPTVTAVFDPTAAKIPLPNDLVFAAPINTVCPAPSNGFIAPTDPPKCAQAELIRTFNPTGQLGAGKFPSDQEVPLTIDFTENTYENGRLKLIAPALDLATITPATLFVVGAVGATVGPVALETSTADDYFVGTNADGTPADHGTLTVHRKDHLPWASGGYTLVMRGGDMGVKTKDSIPVTPSPVFALVEQGKDMTLPENLGLLKAQNNGSTVDALAQGQQLNLLIGIYKATAFPAAENVGKFPHEQMAIASTFQIDTTVTNVTVDPARGLAPLPFDLLRDPTTHKLSATAACAFLNTKVDKTGKCPNPAAAGFLAIDGFSTTGAILAPTSALIDVATVTSDTLKLYDLSDPKNPVEVTSNPPAGSLIREPCEFTSQFTGTTCDASRPNFAPVLAFQPAGATSGDPTSVFRTKPLKDNTDYAVLLTTDIKDATQKAIGPGTVAKILRFTNPLFVGGHSALQGIDDTTALSLDNMRKQIAQMFTALIAHGTTPPSNVAMVYTFHTQTELSTAVQLGALPYTKPNITALPNKDTFVAETREAAFAKFGVVPRPTPADTTPGLVPLDNIDEILEVDIPTFNLLDPASGAFLPDPSMAVTEPIHVLIATPKPAAAPPCPAAPNPLSAFNKCAPLVVFRHGLGRGRADMLLIADSFAAQGMVTVAIDAAKHGDRTLCNTHPDPADPNPANKISGCVPSSKCTVLPGAVGQGDPPTPGPPGTCDVPAGQVSGLLKRPVAANATGNTDGIAVLSSQFLISANFFRTRDTFRQDVIDQSQLIRAIAFAPTGPPPTGHVVFDHILTHSLTVTAGATSMIIDPTTIYFSGQSLGSIQGAMDVASNPRISRAAFNVGGGTVVDVFATAPAFHAGFTQLIGSLGITPGTPQFIQFLTVAKTILDPADPINFMGHLTDPNHMLPNLLPPLGGNPNGAVPQAPKTVLSQAAQCDDTVPNPFNFVYASNVGSLTPLPPTGAPGTFQLFVSSDAATPTCPGGGGVSHGFLTDFSKPPVAGTAQTDLASFLKTGQPVPSVEHP